MSAGREQLRAAAPIVSELLVLAAVVGCPFALGGTSTRVITIFAFVALMAALLAMIDARLQGRSLAWGLGGSVVVGMLVLVGLQRLPLSPALVAKLAPSSADLLQFVLGPHGLYPSWRPLSLDPPATELEWLKHAGYVALYAAVAQRARSRSGRRRLMFMVAGVGALLALSAALHAVFELHTFLGVEGWVRTGLVSPFLDRNHLCSVLDLSTLIQLGLAFRTDDRRKTFAWGGLALITGTTALLANSRAGALTLLAGLAVFAAFLGSRAEGDRRIRSIRAALAVTLGVGAIGVAVYLNSELLLARWASLLDERQVSDSVVSLWPTVVPLVRDHWLTGVGRGAFQSAFSLFQTNFAPYTVTHPENVLLQLTSEFGLVAGLALMVLLAGAWVSGVRRFDLSAAEAGLAAGLFAVGLHEFADFGLELTGVAVPTLVVLATLEIRPEARGVVSTRAGAPAWLALLAGVGFLALHPPVLLREDRADLDALSKRGPGSAVVAAAWEAANRHPVDYVLQLTPAFAEVRATPPNPREALAWANRAMYLAPLSPWPHRAAAEALLELGLRSQAVSELRLAFAGLGGDPGFRGDLLRLLHTPEEFANAVPQDANGFSSAMDLVRGSPKVEVAVGELALTRLALEEPEVLRRLSQAEADVGDHAKAQALARRALAASDSQPAGYCRLAREQRATGEVKGAEATLRDGLRRSPGESSLSIELADLLAGDHRPAEAHELLAKVASSSVSERVSVLGVDARIWSGQGLAGKALADLRQAAQLDPRDAGRRFDVARVLESQGRVREAVMTIGEGIALLPSNQRADSEAWRARLKAQLDTQERDRLLHESEAPPSGEAQP